MGSTLENFENSMNIKPFDIGVKLDNSFSVDYTLSFENDSLSFESQNNVKEVENTENTEEVKELNIPRSDYDRIVEWVCAINNKVTRPKDILLYNEVVERLKDGKISNSELYAKLRKLKNHLK